MDHINTCIVGAGVIGLAIGRQLASSNSEVMVLDRHPQYGQGISSRNSEVIHAGIYYPRNSLKATLCVKGKKLLYDYCDERGVAVKQCGKLIVATCSDEEPVLESILENASANGVDDLEYWSGPTIKKREPQVNASLGLYSPSTGIVSSHQLMTAFLADLEQFGGSFVGDALVKSIEIIKDGFLVNCDVQGGSYAFTCRVLINSAGLGAQKLASCILGFDKGTIPGLHYCKGNYFQLASRNPFTHLIYPVPETHAEGLGIHATFDLGGQVKFGPDVEYTDSEDYSVTIDRLGLYYAAVRRYYPALGDGQLSPAYTGIRPKLQGPGEQQSDFVIQGESTHGVERLVQLYGIESPGLTSSMAIADYVANLLPNH
ncbi:MAG: FAD-dependent oxidoreductase [Gammaproteobacteria bacterium]|jgi:L-2-hydroxyglutarate oxidase LhgO|nr:FAD-dependent oxidoreductase [Gammaproteobacteria bacterium]|tara:strand:+ start:317 stop:1432 length:1116 start_codon:yes stop_codon:yes gene_type:complete